MEHQKPLVSSVNKGGGHNLKTVQEIIELSEIDSHLLLYGDQDFRLPKQIRKFQPSDYEPLKNMMNDYLSEYYDGHDDKNPLLDQLINRENHDDTGFFTKNKYVLIYQDEVGNPIGLITVNNKRGPSIKSGPLLVHASAQGKGVGKTLKLCAELVALQLGKNKIYATTSALNERAVQLNISNGYKPEVYYQDQYKKGSPEVVLGKILGEKGRNEVEVKPVKSVLDPTRCKNQIAVHNANSDDLEYIESVRRLYEQWHDDLGQDFTEGMINGHNRGMDFQSKGKNIFIAHDSEKNVGIGTLTPKRGGPCKLYPIAGTRKGQESIILESEKMCNTIGATKIYTFVQENDNQELEFLLSQGFRIAKNDNLGINGIIESPYKIGYNLIALEKMLS